MDSLGKNKTKKVKKRTKQGTSCHMN